MPSRPADTPRLEIAIATDGRRGIENQALGLAEAVAARRDATIHRLQVRQPSRLDSWRWFWQLPTDADEARAIIAAHCHAPVPPRLDVWIGCGRAAVDLTRMARRLPQPPLVVQVQHPRRPTGGFDLVFPPRHDGLAPTPRVIPLLGSPNRINRDVLDRAGDIPAPARFDERALIAMCIGGNSKKHRFTDQSMAQLCRDVEHLTVNGHQVWITTSRRTPAQLADGLRRLQRATPDRIWLWTGDQDGPNPYARFLRDADYVVVTSDSTNMLTEAASAGRKVLIWPMAGRDGKFTQLYSDLIKGGWADWFTRDADYGNCAPVTRHLDETGRAATILCNLFSVKETAP